MAELLKGKAVADSLTEVNKEKAEQLKAAGIIPTLAIVRLGENPSDMSYERGALKRAEQTGVAVKQFVFPENMTQDQLIGEIHSINNDESIHGVLIFRPLPKHIDDKAVCDALASEKDMDGITSGSMAGVFMDSGEGYPPCTAAACMEILEHYGIELQGKKVTVMGRSLVIGKPVAMMAMKRNATVTVCHSKTSIDDFKAAGRNADIVIAALGRAKMIDAERLGDGQIIIDVGINVDEDGKLCGDVNFDEAEPKADKITPVPGGVGSVTTAVLMKHVIEAAGK
ncbi:MAG: bifunctional 5,10-methylenetetrahydrofolate dehydrogenase/5,10-methenyltetrahydrofolate cyclohydrolase [Bacillota bacterium]|nr:bifunctional 5,10-methylenetetrahydrofolate dehydrogenase/5,10-methenyltetrahydrofolate cyclohydrolase [Bacillota bacterium]